MAAALLDARLSPSHEVGSAGIAAVVGRPPTAEMKQSAAQRGLDLSSHRARQLNVGLASSFDLLLVMEREHRSWVTSNIPQASGRTFTMGHWRSIDIPDPFGASMEHYEQVCDLIEACTNDWLERLP